MVAVVAGDAGLRALSIDAAVQEHPPAQVRVDVPARAASPRRTRRSRRSRRGARAGSRPARRSGSTRHSASARRGAGAGPRRSTSASARRGSAPRQSLPTTTPEARIAAARRTRQGGRRRSRSGSRPASGTKIMSVFVESSHRFDGFARRAAAFRATGSTTARWVRAAEALRVHRGGHAEHAQQAEAAHRSACPRSPRRTSAARRACCSRRR